MDYPLISVIIPVYNASLYLENTLRGVLNQSYSNIEVIVVDDGSKEDLNPILEDLNDERISYYKLPHNNANVARNYGVDRSKGQYIAMLDADDIWLPEHLASCLRSLTISDADGTYGSIILRNGSSDRRVGVRMPFEEESFLDYLLKTGYGAQTSTLFMRADAARETGWDASLFQHQDYDFTLRFSLRYKWGYREEATVIYHISSSEKRTDFNSCINFIERNRSEINPIVYRDYCANMLVLAKRQQAEPTIVRYYLKEQARYKEHITYRDYFAYMPTSSRLGKLKMKLIYIWGILRTDENRFKFN